jgi:hypothetical protein
MTKDEIILAQQARIEQLTNFIKYAQVSSGVCCCGDSMEGHPSPMTCGHSPVDMWDYYSGELLEAYPDDLSALRAHDEKLRNECDELKAKLDGAAKVVLALVQVARAAWNAADNGLGVLVDNGIELRVSPVDFDAIFDALALLDMLPDDKPGFTLNGPARAEWALRNLLCNAT